MISYDRLSASTVVTVFHSSSDYKSFVNKTSIFIWKRRDSYCNKTRTWNTIISKFLEFQNKNTAKNKQYHLANTDFHPMHTFEQNIFLFINLA